MHRQQIMVAKILASLCASLRRDSAQVCTETLECAKFAQKLCAKTILDQKRSSKIFTCHKIDLVSAQTLRRVSAKFAQKLCPGRVLQRLCAECTECADALSKVCAECLCRACADTLSRKNLGIKDFNCCPACATRGCATPSSRVRPPAT